MDGRGVWGVLWCLHLSWRDSVCEAEMYQTMNTYYLNNYTMLTTLNTEGLWGLKIVSRFEFGLTFMICNGIFLIMSVI